MPSNIRSRAKKRRIVARRVRVGARDLERRTQGKPSLRRPSRLIETPYSGKDSPATSVSPKMTPRGSLTQLACPRLAVNAGSVVVVGRLRRQPQDILSRNDLNRFGLKPDASIAALVKRLRCIECGNSSVMAKRTSSQTLNNRRSDAPDVSRGLPDPSPPGAHGRCSLDQLRCLVPTHGLRHEKALQSRCDTG
jgi:hypothetical protein